MKKKLVTWGTNAQKEKVLLAIELQSNEGKIKIFTIPAEQVSEELMQKMMNDWRDDKAEVEMPEGTTELVRELSVAESLLPEGLNADRPDLLSRAQTEWQFVILSEKLHQAYRDELAEIKEKAANIAQSEYKKVFNNLRALWDKVQTQSRDRNLYREHAENLRDDINHLFNDLKRFKTDAQSEFLSASQVIVDEFNEKLADIESRIQAGGGKLAAAFDDLKALQSRYRTEKISNEHREPLWQRIDAAFKAAKERRFGPGAGSGGGGVVDRLKQRIKGLDEVAEKIQSGLKRDEEELAFQSKKIATTEGQLEAQIRQAKVKMIEERIAGKRERLADIAKTRADVERQIKSAQDREDKKQRYDSALADAKKEISSSIKTKPVTDGPIDAETGEAPPPSGDNLLDAISNVLGDTFEDVVDTVKAVANVVGEKAHEALNEALDKAEEVVDNYTKEKAEKKAAAETVAEAPAADETPAETVAASETPEAEVVADQTPASETPEAENDEKTA